MTKLVLRIPWATPSLNEVANRRSRFAYRATRARWMKRVSDAWLDAKAEWGRGRAVWPRPPHGRVRVTVERFGRTEHALDADNMMGGLKPVLDALRALQLVDDDRHAAIDLVALQPRNPYRSPLMWTQITLERLEGEQGGD